MQNNEKYEIFRINFYIGGFYNDEFLWRETYCGH